MLVSGVRSSWETFETNSDLARSISISCCCRWNSESADAGVSASSFSATPSLQISVGPTSGARASRSPEPNRPTISSSEDNDCRMERSPGRLVDGEGTDDPEGAARPASLMTRSVCRA